MKKGIYFGCVPGESLEDRFKLVKDAGLHGVEIGPLEKPKDRKLYAKLAEKYGIEIHSIMGGKGWSAPLSHPDPKVRKEGMDNFVLSLETAKAVGATCVLCVPGIVNEEVTYEQCWERSSACLKKLAPLAEKMKIPIGVENVWNKFLLSPIEFARYVDEIGSPYIQAYYDVGNYVHWSIPQQWIRTLGKRIKKVHVKGFDAGQFKWCGLLEGTINWIAVSQALKDIGYDDYLTIEIGPYRQFGEEMVYDESRHLDRIIAGK